MAHTMQAIIIDLRQTLGSLTKDQLNRVAAASKTSAAYLNGAIRFGYRIPTLKRLQRIGRALRAEGIEVTDAQLLAWYAQAHDQRKYRRKAA